MGCSNLNLLTVPKGFPNVSTHVSVVKRFHDSRVHCRDLSRNSLDKLGNADLGVAAANVQIM